MSLKATIVGAGFSGLTLAYYLQKNGYEVEVIEQSSTVGGLLQSPSTEYGPIDLAANGLLLSQELIDICQDINLEILYPSVESKKKFIWHKGQLSRWPFSFFYTIYIIFLMVKFKCFKNKKKPRPQESLSSWGQRVFSKKLVSHLIEPAFQGVYAERADQLSASLVTRGLFSALAKNKVRGRSLKRQTVSFEKGVSQFVVRLSEYLQQQGVNISLNKKLQKLPQGEQTFILTGSPPSTGHLLTELAPKISQDLRELNLVSVAKVALFFDKQKVNPQGFGCLFPKESGFQSLGLLFDSSLFPNRYKNYSLQTWIVGHEKIQADTTDNEILQIVKQDLQKLDPKNLNFAQSHIKLWKNTLPKYDIALEKFLAKYDLSREICPHVYLHGNYTGQLGLSQILLKSKQLADRINYEQTR